MTQQTSKCSSGNHFCTVRIDRGQLGADSWSDRRLRIAGFRVERDSFVRQQTTSLRAYTRLKNLKNLKTGTTVAIQYQTACTWLPRVKATVNAGRKHELCRSELEAIFRAFDRPWLLLTELALDFLLDSDIDRTFVRAHGIFGKCVPIGGNLYETLNYGGRKSHKFARAYCKSELNSYRVEIEFHSAWLRSHGIREPRDLCKLSTTLSSQFAFVSIDWERLERCLRRQKGREAADILEQVRARSHVLHRALKFLRKEVGIPNTHRFLVPMGLNQEIQESLRLWSRRWGCGNAS